MSLSVPATQCFPRPVDGAAVGIVDLPQPCESLEIQRGEATLKPESIRRFASEACHSLLFRFPFLFLLIEIHSNSMLSFCVILDVIVVYTVTRLTALYAKN